MARGFDPHGTGSDRMFVVRSGGRLYGWRDACPHYGDTPMAWRKDAYLNAEGSRIVCSAHGALFLPDTGECTRGPCLGQNLFPVALDCSRGDVYLQAEEYEGPNPT
jgi:nitrite reductase/ring-hydroxylating ferredoxin subunit